MARVPTEAQYRLLRVVCCGTVIGPRKREFGPLVRRGWMEPDPAFTPKGDRELPPLRLTADGVRALADAVDAYGWPTDPPVARRISDGAVG